jgi:plastocyanin
MLSLQPPDPMTPFRFFAALSTTALLVLGVTACGDDRKPDGDDDHASGSSPGKVASVKPTGRRFDVNMITDSRGERYDPLELNVVRGDSVSFVLQSGVHNVSFPAGRNPASTKLPPVGELLQLPGQKSVYLIDLPEGRYLFQCDIHVAVGMTGHIIVKDGD